MKRPDIAKRDLTTSLHIRVTYQQLCGPNAVAIQQRDIDAFTYQVQLSCFTRGHFVPQSLSNLCTGTGIFTLGGEFGNTPHHLIHKIAVVGRLMSILLNPHRDLHHVLQFSPCAFKVLGVGRRALGKFDKGGFIHP